MDAQPVDYTQYTEAELLRILSRIVPRENANFPRLVAVLEARGYEVRVEESGGASARRRDPQSSIPLDSAVRLSPGQGALAWFEPSRNDFRLVGSGRIRLGGGLVIVTGRRVVFGLGLPLKLEQEIDRERIVNVELLGAALRFEVERHGGRPLALTCHFEKAAAADQFARRLPERRTPDFQPRLASQIEFEERIRARGRWAPITGTLIALNTLAFIVGAIVRARGVGMAAGVETVLGSNFGPFTTDGEWWRLLTSMFLHLGFFHVAFNMWALAATGPLVERLYGSSAFAVLYLGAGLIASMSSVMWQPDVNSVGASGAIFGVYGALLAILWRSRGSIPIGVIRPIRYSVLVFVFSVLLAGLFARGIDNAAHFGGLLAGFAVGAVLARPFTAAPVERSVVSRIGIALPIIATLLVAGGFVAVKRAQTLTGEAQFWRALRFMERVELRVTARHNEIWKSVHEGRLNDSQFAAAIESDLVPPWQAIEQRFAAVELPAHSRLAANLRFATALAVSRSKGYKLCVNGLRAGSKPIVEQCGEELVRGNRMVDKGVSAFIDIR